MPCLSSCQHKDDHAAIRDTDRTQLLLIRNDGNLPGGHDPAGAIAVSERKRCRGSRVSPILNVPARYRIWRNRPNEVPGSLLTGTFVREAHFPAEKSPPYICRALQVELP